jgi:hypothetical protein
MQKARPFANMDKGILEMLTALCQRGFKLGLISNASSEEVTAWQHSALAPLYGKRFFATLRMTQFLGLPTCRQ